MPAHEAVNGRQPLQISVPSIALNATPGSVTERPPFSPTELGERFWRLLQELPDRRQKKQERVQTVVSSPHNKEEYQQLWRKEINDHLVNPPKSQLRKLFKRPRAAAGPDGRNTPEPDPPQPGPPSPPPPPPPPAAAAAAYGVNGAQQLQRSRIARQGQNAPNDNNISAAGDWEADKIKLEHVFLQRRVWKSWQYKCSYPRLATFLTKANHEIRSRCEVSMRDFPYEEEENCLDEWHSIMDEDMGAPKLKVQRDVQDSTRQVPRLRRQRILNHERLWERIRSRFKAKGQQNYVLGRRDTSYMIPCRALQILDLSPNCACLLLESSPRMDLSYIAMFMERHLTNSNWATVNLIVNTGPTSKLRNYLFEYHFSFYHVTSRRTNHDDGYGDERNARQVSPFTAGPKAKARRIYEEQLSFITIGHGGDVYTNIQLAEKYSCDPNDDLYESPFYVRLVNKNREDAANRFEDDNRGIAFFVSHLKPASAFLAWIANSMRHVVARWQTAISAVDREIESNFQATFHGDKHSLLADDSSFSRSKKYVWALQVYKVFQKKLEETIKVWRDFEEFSLDRLDQDQLVTHKEESLIIIKAAVAALELKRDHVSDKHREVSDMKDGLFATSQLLDSRNTVTQNENIRLLTYVNLLFLPLAFCTSIFGMQTILPSHVHGVYFAVTICAVTLFTIFMVFNLQLLIEMVEGIGGKVTKWLRRSMNAHHRRHWHKTAQALQTSREAKNIIVQNRLRRNSAWMYFVYLLEFFFIMIPVHEIEASHRLWGLRRHIRTPKPVTARAGATGLTGVPDRVPREEKANLARTIGRVVFSVVRAVFLPVWLILVGLEVGIVSTYLLLIYAAHVCKEAMQLKPKNDLSLPPPTKEKNKKAHPFRIPLQLLGFYVESEVRLPPNIQRKIKRWREIIAESQGNSLDTRTSWPEDDKPYFVQRSDAEKEEAMQTRQLRARSRSPGGLRVQFAAETRPRRRSEGNITPSESSISPRPSPTRARTSSGTFHSPPMVEASA